MKRIRWALVTAALVTAALVLLFTLCCVPAHADGGVLRLPAAVEEIEDQAFYGDSSLNTVILPDGICRLGAGAFANSSVRQIFLPGSLEPKNIADDRLVRHVRRSALHERRAYCLSNRPFMGANHPRSPAQFLKKAQRFRVFLEIAVLLLWVRRRIKNGQLR